MSNQNSPTKLSRQKLSPKLRWEIRHLLAQHMLTGGALTSVADAISHQYNVSSGAIIKDWERRKNWLPILANVDDAKVVMEENLLTLKRATSEAWAIVAQARQGGTNLNAAIGGVKVISEMAKLQIEILQSLGKLPKISEPVAEVNITDARTIQVLNQYTAETAELLRAYEAAAAGAEAADIRANRAEKPVLGAQAAPS